MNAYIPADKIMGYLLSETHAVGKSKARFFRSLGFDEATAGQLERELLAIAQAQEVKESITSPHGTKYVIDGPLRTPQGVAVRVRTIWIVEVEQENPRLVTAYPIE
jgi:hypothetical protein